jgi:hypothetical protein
MKKIKIIAGITWAFLSLILIIVLFPGLTGFSASVSKLPFMKIHPRYAGGEVEKQIVTQSCTLDVRKPVFKGLISDRKTGFVQLDWRGTIPAEIRDTIDYDFDGIPDFYIQVDTKTSKTEMYPFNKKVKGLGISTSTSFGWAVRVSLIKRSNY